MSSPEIIEGPTEGDASAAPPTKKKSKKKLMIIGAAGAVVLLGGGGGFMMMSGGSSADSHAEGEADAGGHDAPAESGGHGGGGESGGHGEGAGGAFVDVPSMLVNLRSPDGAPRFLKIHLMLVPGEKGSVAKLTEELPLILDSYQPFLRELRPEDLAGSAAVYRVKEELLRRAIGVAGKGSVADVLIQDLVQQ